MSRYLKKPDEAVARFAARAAVCSEFRKDFAGAAFDRHFDRYYASKAISEERRKRLGELMKNPEIVAAMEAINRALHDMDIKGKCYWREIDKKPAVFWRNLICSILVLGTFGWTAFTDGFDPQMLPGIASGAVVFWYAIRYDWL
jgi:hypothetical protein